MNYVLLRVFALILFFRLITAFSEASKPASATNILITAVLVILCILARPHFILVAIPGFGLFALWRLVRRQFLDWKHLVFGLALPGMVLLLIQAFLLPQMQNVGTGGGFAIMPFALATHTEKGDPLFPKFLLSILFPAALYGFYWQKARAETSLNLAWLCFWVSTIFTYFFVETERISHFNFIATSQIALFILMVISVQFFLYQIRRENTFLLARKDLILLLFFALHFISGIIWIYAQTIGGGRAWW